MNAGAGCRGQGVRLLNIYIYIYIYIYILSRLYSTRRSSLELQAERFVATCVQKYAQSPYLPTNIVDFREFDSSIMLILRGGILMSIGDFPEGLSRAMLVGTM